MDYFILFLIIQMILYFFEGHSVREIDTVDYCISIFNRFGVNSEFLWCSQSDTKLFFYKYIRGKPIGENRVFDC